MGFDFQGKKKVVKKRGSLMTEDEVRLVVATRKKGASNGIRVYIGENIMLKLGWRLGQTVRIGVGHGKDKGKYFAVEAYKDEIASGNNGITFEDLARKLEKDLGCPVDGRSVHRVIHKYKENMGLSQWPNDNPGVS